MRVGVCKITTKNLTEEPAQRLFGWHSQQATQKQRRQRKRIWWDWKMRQLRTICLSLPIDGSEVALSLCAGSPTELCFDFLKKKVIAYYEYDSMIDPEICFFFDIYRWHIICLLFLLSGVFLFQTATVSTCIYDFT
jgi:hypothetical protein